MDIKNKIIKELNLRIIWDIDGVSVYADDNIAIQLIEPHPGTNNKFAVRAEYHEDFDRWSVALYEKYIESEEDLSEVILDLKDMSENK